MSFTEERALELDLKVLSKNILGRSSSRKDRAVVRLEAANSSIWLKGRS